MKIFTFKIFKCDKLQQGRTLLVFGLVFTFTLVLASVPQGASAGAVVRGGNIVATGGTISTTTQNGVTYKTHTFASSGTFQVTAGSGKVWYLVVAGGGGGAGAGDAGGGRGGGGAGGFRTNSGYTYPVSRGSYTVTVGGGGAGKGGDSANGDNGENSVFDAVTATGGGGGARWSGSPTSGSSGGSGGGATQGGTGGSGTAGQGNNGGNGDTAAGGGGGGAGTVGGNGSGPNGGNGGAGSANTITGSSVTYAGGGGAGCWSGGTGGTGGSGGGGAGICGAGTAGSGTANTGGGGGGSGGVPSAGTGGNGGSGVVIIRYPISSMNAKAATGSGLVGWWTFDGADVRDKIYDRSGKGNHGYFYNGATTTANIAGKLGKAFSFDGSDDKFVANDADIFSFPGLPFSVSVWVKPTATPADLAGVVGKWNNQAPATKEWLFRFWTGSTWEFRLIDSSNTSIGRSTSATIPVGQWTHMVGIYDGTTSASGVAIYMNGVRSDTTNVGSTYGGMSNTSAKLYFAAIEDTVGGDFNFFNGSIDDVRVYNRALSYAEIQQLYQSSKNTLPKVKAATNDGLVARWTFDKQDVTDKIYDRSGKGNHGYYVSGATSTAMVQGKLGGALNFTSGNDHVRVYSPSGLPLGSSPRTMTAWVKRTGVTTGTYGAGDLITYGQGDCTGKQSALGSGTGSNGNLWFWGGCQDLSSGLTFPNNEWTFVAATYDGSVVTRFVNQTYVSSSLGALSTAASDFFIGAETTTNGSSFRSHFIGDIDDVRIYNRALSVAEVLQLYSSR